MEPARETPEDAGEEYAYLLGSTSLREHLDFMTSEPIGAEDADLKTLADGWRAAQGVYRKIRRKEASWADDPPVEPMPEALREWVDRVQADPIFRRAFAAVPVTLGLVELDRLVATQKTVSLEHVRRIADRLGPDPSADEVFRLCLPYDHPLPSSRVARLSDSEFVFLSESSDLRYLDTALLRPDQVPGFETFGPLVGVVAVAVGFGSNYLNVIAHRGRLILNNGYHRAYALRQAGSDLAPCVIQKVTSRGELGVVGNSALKRDPGAYLDRPRPPVLKDFFNPNLCDRVSLIRTRKQVRVNVGLEERDMP